MSRRPINNRKRYNIQPKVYWVALRVHYDYPVFSCENYLFSFAVYDGKLSCVLLCYCLISPVIAKDSLIELRNKRELYCRFSNENDSRGTTTSTRFPHRNTVSASKPASFWREYHRSFSMRFCKNVDVSNQFKNMVMFLFFDQQKGSVTSNKNNWATYTTIKE